MRSPESKGLGLGLLACAMLALVAGCTSPLPMPARTAAQLAAPPTLDPEQARKLINDYRAEQGLGPLVIDARLTAAAHAHARDLANGARFGHHGSDGSNPWQRVQRAGYSPRLAAENVAAGQASLEDVLRGWKRSRGHNANLLQREATHMGIALVYDPTTRYQTYWTLLVATPM